MDLKLTGKRALVTGASAGIGESTALHLAAEGAKLIVHGRNAERTEAVARKIAAAGGEAKTVLGDLSTDEGAAAVAEAALAAWDGIDILVNNAGGPSNPMLTWGTITSEDWLRTYEINFLSTIRMIQHCVPGMKRNGWGRIIQISSMSSLKPGPNIPDYSSVKAMLPGISVSLAKELANSGITVNSVAPGLILTKVLKDYFLGLPENAGKDWSEIEAGIATSWGSLVGRIGAAEDVAVVIAFLASPLAGFITGANIRTDGGMPGVVA